MLSVIFQNKLDTKSDIGKLISMSSLCTKLIYDMFYN